MRFVDLIIIYLACGAPFGVYQLFVSDNSDRSIMSTAAAILLWPILAVKQFIGLFDAEIVRARTLRDIRTAIEETAFGKTSAEELFDFREVFDRYTGLASAGEFEHLSVGNLLEAVDHPSSGLAARCHARLNMRRIDIHRERAKHELIALLSVENTCSVRPMISLQLERLASSLDEDGLELIPYISGSEPETQISTRPMTSNVGVQSLNG
jgi:hypothetical protein